MSVTQPAISTDVALRLIANQQRREILQILHDRDGTGVPLTELVAELADGASQSHHHSTDPEARTRIAVTHNHLPKLDAHEIITFDQETEVVAHGPAFDVLAPVLTVLHSHADDLPSGFLPDEPAGW